MSRATASLSHLQLTCSSTPSKRSPTVRVKYARLKFPRLASVPAEVTRRSRESEQRGVGVAIAEDGGNESRGNESGGSKASCLTTIVDGTAFTTTYHSYLNDRSQDVLEDYGYEFGYEYPLRAEIFKHARNERTTRYVNATQPVYYVAALRFLTTDFAQWSSAGRMHEYKYYLASYHRSNTCDWRDDLSIREVIFGPRLLSELRILEQ